MVLSEVEHGVLVALVYHHRSYNLHHSSSQTDTPGLVGCPLGGKRFALRTHPPLRRELPSPSYFRFLLGARPPPPRPVNLVKVYHNQLQTNEQGALLDGVLPQPSGKVCRNSVEESAPQSLAKECNTISQVWGGR